jgi:AMP phosphorylase
MDKDEVNPVEEDEKPVKVADQGGVEMSFKEPTSYAKEMVGKIINIETHARIVLLHVTDAEEMGILPLERLEICCSKSKKRVVAIVDLTEEILPPGEIGLFKEVAEELGAEQGATFEVKPMGIPESLYFIKKKIRGGSLSEEEINDLVRDVTENRLTDIELSAFMTAVFIHGFNLEETVAMTRSLYQFGRSIELEKGPVLDKHCIGGINGRTTMLVVPIVASEGYFIPKTSSRSITSAAGTADCMEVLCNVALSVEEIKEITERVGGVICWGGAVELAPADDKIIKIEHPLGLDPKGQIVASVMAKKASVGAKFVVIDMPVGPDVKIKDNEVAKKMAGKFIEVGKKLGMKVEAVITDGTEPSGKAFGPALESRYVMEVLEGKFFDNLAQKACELAGALFELVGRVEAGKGYALAKESLKSGKALEKMKEMIQAQEGTILSSEQIELSDLKTEVKSEEEGTICRLNVRRFSNIAREAGAPADKKAGVMLKVVEGSKIKKGDVLFEIYAENPRKLAAAKEFAQKNNAVEMERIILEKIR